MKKNSRAIFFHIWCNSVFYSNKNGSYFRRFRSIILCSRNYTGGELLVFSVDNYDVGVHNETIWAIGLDGKETYVLKYF